MSTKENKFGRNSLCPCGSGKKHKRCCLTTNISSNRSTEDIPPEIYNEIQKKIQNNITKEKLREQNYGKVRPIIHADFKGHKLVAVGKKLHWSKSWETFPDFLLDYIKKVLGSDWGNSEIAKPYEERHPILKWHEGLCHFQNQQKKGKDGLICAIPNGVAAAYFLLAYDLYILNHHSALQEKIIKRLKHKDQFQGVRYELFVAATCIRAGFDIAYEDETDKTKKHPEFVATHRLTRQKISVEAKSRHRQDILGFNSQKESEPLIKVRIGSLLNEAMQKPTDYPYIIFIDLNLPPYPGVVFDKPWFKEILKTLDRINSKSEQDPKPCNLILFTNHPHHYGMEDEPDPKKDILPVFAQYPKIPAEHPETILGICDAALQYGNIPNEFPNN